MFTEQNTKSLKVDGSFVVITGGSSGIGYETARKLAVDGANVLIAGRNPEKTKAAAKTLSLAADNPVRSMVVDLSSLSDVRSFAEKLVEVHGVPEVLINNAGVYMRKYKKSADGFEYTMAVNYLAPVYLTLLLSPLMADIKGETRIVNPVSGGYVKKGFELPAIFDIKMRGAQAYNAAKRALMYSTFEIAERLMDSEVSINCVNPGRASTNLLPSDTWYWRLAVKLTYLYSDPPAYAADNVIYAAFSPELGGKTGKYVMNMDVAPVKEGIFDSKTQKNLWAETMKLLEKSGHPAYL